MIVELPHGWRIQNDDRFITLAKRVERTKGKRAGQVDWVPQSWHGDVLRALKSYIERRVAGSDVRSAESLVRLIRSEMDRLEEIAQRIEAAARSE